MTTTTAEPPAPATAPLDLSSPEAQAAIEAAAQRVVRARELAAAGVTAEQAARDAAVEAFKRRLDATQRDAFRALQEMGLCGIQQAAQDAMQPPVRDAGGWPITLYRGRPISMNPARDFSAVKFGG